MSSFFPVRNHYFCLQSPFTHVVQCIEITWNARTRIVLKIWLHQRYYIPSNNTNVCCCQSCLSVISPPVQEPPWTCSNLFIMKHASGRLASYWNASLYLHKFPVADPERTWRDHPVHLQSWSRKRWLPNAAVQISCFSLQVSGSTTI